MPSVTQELLDTPLNINYLYHIAGMESREFSIDGSLIVGGWTVHRVPVVAESAAGGLHIDPIGQIGPMLFSSVFYQSPAVIKKAPVLMNASLFLYSK